MQQQDSTAERVLAPVEDRLLGILIGTALHRSTISYSDLADLLELRLDWQRDRAWLGEYLNHVADYSLAEWGVVLSALAVGKRENMPSGRRGINNEASGFYAWCAAQGLDTTDPAALVINEQRKAYNRFAP